MQKTKISPGFPPLLDAPTRSALEAYIGVDRKVVFSVMRNEVNLVRAWVAHYRGMGIDKIVVVDNASVDGTLELLRDLGVFTMRTEQPFSTSNFGMQWLEEFVAEVRDGIIVLNVDCDELLVYEGWPDLDVHHYLKDFESSDCDTIFGFMMDMYPDGPLKGAPDGAVHDLFSVAPLHDSDYVFRLRPNRPWHRRSRSIEILGGPRARMLSSLKNQQRSTWLGYSIRGQIDRFIHHVPTPLVGFVIKSFPKQMPELVKYPIFKARQRSFTNNHSRTGDKLYSQNIVLCHFKFLPGFKEKCRDEMRRAEHYRRGAEYFLYMQGLKKLNNGDLRYPGSTRFCPGRLSDMRIIRDLSEFPST